MSFPRHAKYKDSLVPWLGSIPAKWDVIQGRRLFIQKRDPSLPSDQQLSATQKYGVVPQSQFMELEDQKVTLALSGLDNFKHVEANDFVISLRSFQGGIEHSPHSGCVSPAYTILRPVSDVFPPFWKYLLKSRGYIEALQSVTDGIRDGKNISYDQFGRVLVPYVPISEQQAIADFLDEETAKIDALIGEQRRLVELLKEKRQAVISHTVTKGLDPNVPLKPSGIEWLGDVPEHWEVGPLKRFWEVVDCKHITVPFIEEGYPVASVMEVREFDLDLSRVLRTDKENYELLISGGRQPQRGDVIYCRNTANTGTSAFVNTDEPICIGQDVVLIKSRQQSGRFLNYILHGPEMAGQLSQYMVGSTFKRINVADIRELIVTFPPTKEQHHIVDYLDIRASYFDTLVSEAERAITLLQERRTALISAAVTGKIDVRGLVKEGAA